MSQTIFDTIIPSSTSGNQLAQILNDFKDALMTGCSGATRPSQIEAGGGWIDDTSVANHLIYKLYTGTADVEVFRVNTTTGVASIASSDTLFEIAKISADAAGPTLKFSKDRIANNGQTLENDVLGQTEYRSSADDLTSPLSARIKAISSNNTTALAAGAEIIFELVKKNEATLTEMMRIKDDGVHINDLTVVNFTATNSELGTVTEVVDAAILLNKGGTQTLANTAKSGFKVEMTDAPDFVLGYDSTKASKLVAGDEGAEVEVVNVSSAQTLTNKTINATNNTITNLTNSAIKSDAAIVLTKLDWSEQVDAASTGANATLATPTKSVMRLTNASLTSVDMVPAIANSILIIENKTGNIVSINNDTGATAANRIITGTGNKISLINNASLILVYSATETKWQVLGGSGGGAGGGSSLNWGKNSNNSCVTEFIDGMKLESFDNQSNQEIYALIGVPSSYNAGSPIKLKRGQFFCASNTGKVFFKTQATLIKAGVVLGTYAYQRDSTNAEVTVNGTSNTINDIGDLDLTDASGLIAGQAVDAGMKILVKLSRDNLSESVSAAADARLIIDGLELSLS